MPRIKPFDIFCFLVVYLVLCDEFPLYTLTVPITPLDFEFFYGSWIGKLRWKFDSPRFEPLRRCNQKIAGHNIRITAYSVRRILDSGLCGCVYRAVQIQKWVLLTNIQHIIRPIQEIKVGKFIVGHQMVNPSCLSAFHPRNNTFGSKVLYPYPRRIAGAVAATPAFTQIFLKYALIPTAWMLRHNQSAFSILLLPYCTTFFIIV